MDMTWNDSIWRQLGAAIGMLDNILRACQNSSGQARLHNERSIQPEFAEFWC